MSKAELLRAIDESLAKMGSRKWARWETNSGPLPLCRLHNIDCVGCPASIKAMGHNCSGWSNGGEEILWFCFARAMVEDTP